jgi:hypothetical protein
MVTINVIIIHYDRYEYSMLVFFFLAISQYCEKRQFAEFFLRPSCLSACKNSTTNGRILMKFDI